MRVLVADDHSLFRDGIVSLLEAAGFEVVGQVGDGQSAIESAQLLRPDLVLMDITMPEMNGLEALRQIRFVLPDTKVVMLTVSEDDSDLFEAIRLGASGYLLKSLNADEFLEMLEGLSHGEAVMTRETTARLMRGFADLADLQETAPDRLSPRELELLQLVAEGLSNKAIGQQLSVSVNTVKYHMKNILQKLGAQNRTEAVMMAIRSGLIKPESSE
ncbi:MAG: response regulator transcription factor [Anaerolineaceae bacterium]|nr:MAG: response regulator transcription factor [Anaerolineaceae bacterium]